MRLKLSSGLLFNVVWLGCVWGATMHMFWLPVLAMCTYLLFHLVFIMPKGREIGRILASASTGYGVDSLWGGIGVLDFKATSSSEYTAPAWIFCLWIAFAASLGGYLSFLRSHPFGAAVTGAVAGPASYFAGSKIGALAFGPDNFVSLWIISASWALIFPALLYFVAAESDNDPSLVEPMHA